MSKQCIKDGYPIYIGIFFNKYARKKFKDVSNINLDKNAHVTLKYLGSEKLIPPDLELLLNTKISVEVIGISESNSGKALIVKHNIPIYNDNPHITIKVNKNSKPVDVGKEIKTGKISPLIFKDGIDGIVTSFCNWYNNIDNINGGVIFNKKSKQKKSKQI